MSIKQKKINCNNILISYRIERKIKIEVCLSYVTDIDVLGLEGKRLSRDI